MNAQEVHYWFEVHSKCRVLDGPAGPSTGELEWYFNQVDITRFCDEVEAKHEAENADLRTALKDIANALVETSNTLESVDPNATSLEMANEAIGKHIRIIGPLIEEIRKEK